MDTRQDTQYNCRQHHRADNNAIEKDQTSKEEKTSLHLVQLPRPRRLHCSPQGVRPAQRKVQIRNWGTTTIGGSVLVEGTTPARRTRQWKLRMVLKNIHHEREEGWIAVLTF